MSTSHDEHRRQGKHEKARATMMEEYERQKADLAKESERLTNSLKASERFTSNKESVEESLKRQTIGLVSAEDFKRKREELEEIKRREAAQTLEIRDRERGDGAGGSGKRKSDGGKDGSGGKKKSKKAKPTLSFAADDEEEEEPAVGAKANGSAAKHVESNGKAKHSPEAFTSSEKKRLIKNPGVDTSFLPDRHREEEERRIREQLRQEWLKKQEEIKNEEIEITYSYWDGSGHRKTVKCKKGDSISHFLEKCRSQIPELRGHSIDSLMYIKEDLIIPHHHTFYEFIINKSRGKSGPLFHFDVHDDVRMIGDARIEKEESHAGKVVERQWFERNKHVFPYNRWEVYDVAKWGTGDSANGQGYTIHDRSKGK